MALVYRTIVGIFVDNWNMGCWLSIAVLIAISIGWLTWAVVVKGARLRCK